MKNSKNKLLNFNILILNILIMLILTYLLNFYFSKFSENESQIIYLSVCVIFCNLNYNFILII